MGFSDALAIRAVRKFPKPEQEIQRIEWILSGKAQQVFYSVS